MSIRVLRAVQEDLCQAEPDELLLPNPLYLGEEDDNDFFVGIRSRRPARVGRVCESDLELPTLLAMEHFAVNGVDAPLPDEDDAETLERIEDIRFLVESLEQFELGSRLRCQYTLEDDELTFDLIEQEEA